LLRDDAVLNSRTGGPERPQGLGKCGWGPCDFHLAAAIGKGAQRARDVKSN